MRSKLWLKNIFSAFSALALFGLTACGSGSDGDDAPGVSGVWSGTVNLSASTCGTREVIEGNFTHTVNQNEDAVVLSDSAGVQYLGNTVGDDGFSVNALIADDQPDSTGNNCDVTQQIEYDELEGSGDTDASVRITTTRACADGFQCEQTSQGTAVRNVAGGGNPSPSPTPTPEPIESCTEVNEINFTGDGGCGILTTELTQSNQGGQNVMILNPFGTNGATSFAVNAQDPLVANSTRTDLSIMTGNDYTCSISCGGRLTFTLTCTDTAGTTCSERF